MTKELYGLQQFPVAIARAQAKITGKAGFAQILGDTYSQIIFGAAQGGGGVLDAATSEVQVVPSTAPYQVTVNNASGFIDDIGVHYAVAENVVSPFILGVASGVEFTRVASPSAVQQYEVNYSTGVYTFSAADAGQTVVIGYTFQAAAAVKQLQIPNQNQGATPVFKLTLSNTFANKRLTLRLNACTVSKFSAPFKLNEWTIQQLDFAAFSDAAGKVGYWTSSE